MDRLTKLLVAAIAFAVVQTVNVSFFSGDAMALGSAIFCWGVVAVIMWKRRALSGKS